MARPSPSPAVADGTLATPDYAGDHQLPPERRRKRRDRRPGPAGDRRRYWIRPSPCAASRPAARPYYHKNEQWVIAEPFEIGLGEFLLRMAGDHRGVKPDAGHRVQDLVGCGDLHPA